MAFIEWDDSLSVNIREIDEQHKTLVNMINQLSDAMTKGKGRTVIGEIIAGLAAYTVTHFQTEEKYFDRFHYPDAEKHKREHEAFVKKVTDFKTAFDSGKVTLSVDVLIFLSNWLTGHIKGTDMEYSVFFIKNGLS